MQIDGGAVEFSWALRSFEGESISCAQARISEVALCWRDATTTGDMTCAEDSSRSFACNLEQGATAFEVETGDQTLWIEVTCAADNQRASVDTYDVPAPIVRTVTSGDIVTLNSLLIVATKAEGPCDGPCTCPL